MRTCNDADRYGKKSIVGKVRYGIIVVSLRGEGGSPRIIHKIVRS